MTELTVSHEGAFKTPEGAWVSQDGQWIPLIEPTPEFEVTFEFAGESEGGMFYATIEGTRDITGYTATLFAKDYADFRAAFARLIVKDAAAYNSDNQSVNLFQEHELPADYQSVLNEARWVTAVYYMEVEGPDGTLIRSDDIVLKGETVIMPFIYAQSTPYMRCAPHDSRTVYSHGNLYTYCPATYNTDSWTNGDDLTIYPARYDFDIPLPTAWSNMEITHYRALGQNWGPSTAPLNLFKMQSEPVDGQPIPTEVKSIELVTGIKMPFVRSDWEVVAPQSLSCHQGEAGVYTNASTAYYHVREGLLLLAFYAENATYDPFEGTITQLDAQTIQVTGPPNRQVFITYENPSILQYDWSLPTDSKVQKVTASEPIVLDASGVGTFNVDSFSGCRMDKYEGLRDLHGGIYRFASANQSPAIYVDGPAVCRSRYARNYATFHEAPFIAPTLIGTTPYDYSGAMSPYTYTYHSSTNDPAVEYAMMYRTILMEPMWPADWVPSGQGDFWCYSNEAYWNLFAINAPPTVGVPHNETRLFGTPDIPGHVPNTSYKCPVHIGWDGSTSYPEGVTGGNRDANPQSHDAWSPPIAAGGYASDYVYVELLIPIVYQGA